MGHDQIENEWNSQAKLHPAGVWDSAPERDVRRRLSAADPRVLEHHPHGSDHPVQRAMRDMDMRPVRGRLSWSVAVPMLDEGSLPGVLLTASTGPVEEDVEGRLPGSALAGPIAAGIRMIDLRRCLTDVEPPQGWERATGELHDGITGSMYSLTLSDGGRMDDPERDRRLVQETGGRLTMVDTGGEGSRFTVELALV